LSGFMLIKILTLPEPLPVNFLLLEVLIDEALEQKI